MPGASTSVSGYTLGFDLIGVFAVVDQFTAGCPVGINNEEILNVTFCMLRLEPLIDFLFEIIRYMQRQDIFRALDGDQCVSRFVAGNGAVHKVFEFSRRDQVFTAPALIDALPERRRAGVMVVSRDHVGPWMGGVEFIER